MSSSSLKFFLVIIGLSILIVGGIYLFKQSSLGKFAKQSLPSFNKTSNDDSTKTPRDSTGLPVTPATTSGKTVEQYVQTIDKEAKESSTLSFTNCMATPGEVKVKTGQKITIKNNDAQDISLEITINFHPTIPAKQSLETTVTQEPSIIAYACVHKGGTTQVRSGIIDITK